MCALKWVFGGRKKHKRKTATMICRGFFMLSQGEGGSVSQGEGGSVSRGGITQIILLK